MRYHKVPDETIRRLPVYLRGVRILAKQGQENVCSSDLARILGINPWQIRKDFSYFGDLGKPGVGYQIGKLERRISRILNLNSGHNVALVGVGNLGSAVLAFAGFGQYGFDIVAVFDTNPKKIGKRRGDLVIEDAAAISNLRARDVDLGIVAVPAEAAQKVVDALVEAGVRGILNFAPVNLAAPKKVKVTTIDIAMELARLPYYLPAG